MVLWYVNNFYYDCETTLKSTWNTLTQMLHKMFLVLVAVLLLLLLLLVVVVVGCGGGSVVVGVGGSVGVGGVWILYTI